MSEQNKALVHRLFEAFWGKKCLAVVDALLSADHADHT